jgi:hypothetical protein
MKSTLRIRICLALIVSLLLMSCALFASGTNTPPMPSLPELRSPVDSFRALLVMPVAERNAQLATRSAEVQQRIRAKISEYQGLTAEERELRLKATELRWYLKPLMTAPATNRAAQMKFVPENFRDMVAARLEQWDKIAPAVQKLILTNEHGANYLAAGSATPPVPPLPTEKIRAALQKRFEKLFELTDSEKEKILATLSDAERQQMERTLESFAKLSPMQRRQCITSFTKFVGMNPTERAEFLKNAQRWSEMTPGERQSWRDLVNTAPKLPPLPQISIRPPPLPSNPNRLPFAPTTNGG